MAVGVQHVVDGAGIPIIARGTHGAGHVGAGIHHVAEAVAVRVARIGAHACAGGIDHIVSKMAAQQNTGVVLDFSRIIDPKTRRTALSRYGEILAFQRKYHFPLLIASGASECLGQRNITEIIALADLFGMTEQEVRSALDSLDGILSPKKTVEIVEERS